MEKPEDYRTSFASELTSILRCVTRMWGLLNLSQRCALSAAVTCMFLGGTANTAIPLLVGSLVDSAQAAATHANAAETLRPTIAWYLALIAAAYVLREALQLARRYLVEDTAARMEKNLFVSVVSRLLMADLAALAHEKIGTLHGRMLRNVSGSVRFLRVSFLDFLPALLTGTLALSTVVATEPWLGLVMAAVIPLNLFITTRQLLSQKGVRLELLHHREEIDGTVVEQLGGIDYIRAANTQHRETERLARAAESLRSKEVRHHVVMSLYGSSKAVGEGLIHVAVLGLAVYLAATGQISFGAILTFSMLYYNLMAPLNEVHRLIDEGHESSLLVSELLRMLAVPPDRSFVEHTTGRVPADHDPIITLDHLHVDYATPNASGRQALGGVTLKIRQGEVIGIAGRSGCGKTTLLRTLMRLVHPNGGHATLGGVPLDQVSRSCIARYIAYVGQSPFVFSGTIGENIAYEVPSATPEDIRRAAQLAGLHDDIMRMPDGYHSRLTERGQNLSGGQRQRLALARALLKDAPILLLDEVTSALDTITERAIQRSLAEMWRDRTILLVAHRLSTLMHADRIVVFDEGRIVETGSYQELVERGGIFTQLVNSAGPDSGAETTAIITPILAPDLSQAVN